MRFVASFCSRWLYTLLLTFSLGVAGCGEDTAASVAPVAAQVYSLGATVTGLIGSGLILEDNGGNNLNVTSNGAVTLSNSLSNGSSYSVTVKTQPSSPTQVCTVANGSGRVNARNITSVAVTCKVSVFSIGGTVSGLTGSGLVLQDNAGNDLPVNTDGGFTFSNSLASGTAYAVTIQSQPSSPAQICAVANGSGMVSTGDVSNVAITCTDAPSCIRVVRNLLDDDLNGYGQAGAPVAFADSGESASFNLNNNSTVNYSLLGGDLSLTPNKSYAVQFTVSGYSGNYPGANLEILGATPAAFSGLTKVAFKGNGIYSLSFTYTDVSQLFLLRIGLNVEDAPDSDPPQGGFTLGNGMWEQLPNASSAPSEFVAGGHTWAFNYANLNSFDPTTGLVTEARGPYCGPHYKNVWAVTADSFGDDTYDFPQQLQDAIATNYAFYVDAVPGRRLSVAEENIDSLLSNASLPANVAKPNGIIVEGGINDIVQGTTVQQLEAVSASIISDVESRELGAILLTIGPFRNNINWTATREQVRIAYNEWLRGQASPGKMIYVYDMAASVADGGISDDSDPIMLDAAMDSGDGLHPNGVGGLQIATGIKAILTMQAQ